LREPLQSLLLDDTDRLLGEVKIADAKLIVQRALEFWPLVGDVASQESGNSRLIDSSTSRIQVILRPVVDSALVNGHWRVAYRKWNVPVRFESDESGPLLLFAFKYRSFAPWRGLHPTLPPQTPVELSLQNTMSLETWKLSLHEWNPEGLPYASLPQDWTESQARRSERVVLEKIKLDSPLPLEDPPPVAITPYCLDFRAYGV